MASGPAPLSILVLCEGNHCRSPIAEGLLKATSGEGITVASAGLGAEDGFAPHPEAIRLMAERGLDITWHRSRLVTSAMVLGADLILVMDQDQKERCEALVPSARGRVFLLGRWLPADRQEIEDPIHQSTETFGLVFEAILEAVDAWQNHLDIFRRLR